MTNKTKIKAKIADKKAKRSTIIRGINKLNISLVQKLKYFSLKKRIINSIKKAYKAIFLSIIRLI